MGEAFLNDEAISLADEQALRWCLSHQEAIDVNSFKEMHHLFTYQIRRSKISTIDKSCPKKLISVVQNWVALFVRYYKFLVARYPNTHGNESPLEKEFGLSKEGLNYLSIASRYAEYWAEGAIHSHSDDGDFTMRFDFIGSKPFVILHQLQVQSELLAYDSRGLSLPSFDILKIVEATPSFKHPWSYFYRANCHLCTLTPDANDRLSMLAHCNFPHPGRIWIQSGNVNFSVPKIPQYLKPGNALEEVIFISQKAGFLARAFINVDELGPVIIVDPKSLDSAFFVASVIRSSFEFCRIAFPSDMADAFSCAYPNQKVSSSMGATYKLESFLANSETARSISVSKLCYLDDWRFRGEDYSYRVKVAQRIAVDRTI